MPPRVLLLRLDALHPLRQGITNGDGFPPGLRAEPPCAEYLGKGLMIPTFRCSGNKVELCLLSSLI